MLTITVDFLLGTYRADAEGHAHTGQLRRGEWPPAPLRLFAALVAADGTRERRRVTSGEALAFLEVAPPPTIYACAPSDVHHEPLHPRYVVQQAGVAVKTAHQEYQGRSGAQVRPGVRMAPRVPRVVYAWDIEPGPQILAGLRARAARVGYLGTADSPVALTVGESRPERCPDQAYVPDRLGDCTVGVPQPGVLAAMDAHYDRWVQHGPSVHRSQSPGLRRLATYQVPGVVVDHEPATPTIIWLRFDRAISGRRITSVTATLKAAVLDLYQRAVGDPPEILHGHVDERGDGYELASYLALPDVGHRRARGLLHGAAVVLPASADSRTVEGCRAVLHDISELRGPGVALDVRPWAGEARPLASNPSRWLGQAAKRFATAFPALHERRGIDVTLGELGRWCAHAGLPAPIAARSARSPFVPGGVDLLPREVNRPGRAPRPYSHLELVFPEPVQGLVVIGAGRHRGLGLCAPLEEARSR